MSIYIEFPALSIYMYFTHVRTPRASHAVVVDRGATPQGRVPQPMHLSPVTLDSPKALILVSYYSRASIGISSSTKILHLQAPQFRRMAHTLGSSRSALPHFCRQRRTHDLYRLLQYEHDIGSEADPANTAISARAQEHPSVTFTSAS